MDGSDEQHNSPGIAQGAMTGWKGECTCSAGELPAHSAAWSAGTQP